MEYDQIFTGQAEEPETQEYEEQEENLPKPSKDVQNRMVDFVKQNFSSWKDSLKPYRERLVDVYEAWATYKVSRAHDYDTNFKVNKAHEIVEKVLPRIVAKDPRWVVEPRLDDFYPDRPLTDENGQELIDPSTIPNTQENYEMLAEAWKKWLLAKRQRYEEAQQFAAVTQDYLQYLFIEYKLRKYLRRLGKSMIINGKGIGKVQYKYEVVQNMTGKKGGQREYKQDVRGEYPTLVVKSWSDVYWDPRYPSFSESPGVIEVCSNVRYWDILRNKEDYFNLQQLKEVCEVQYSNQHGDEVKALEEYRSQIHAIAGIPEETIQAPIDAMNLTITYFYGFFSEDFDTEEKMVEIGVVGAGDIMLFPICYKQIGRIPFVEIDCFEDPEVNLPVGFVEPIMSLMDESNFKKNAASQYINKALYRSWYWSPQSGIDPRDLEDRPGAIITVPDSVTEAQANLQEVELRPLDPSYFQEQNDFDRQIQSMSFTVDTSSQRGQQALTDTATGIRVAFFESNSVINEIRKHFEEGVAELGYQLLIATFEHMEENIVFQKMGTEQYWEMNKELLRDAIMRYNIRVETGSSSYDDVDNRRQEAIAFWNFATGGRSAGLNIDLEEAWMDAADTWEKKNPAKFIKPRNIDQIVAEIMGVAPPTAEGGGNVQPVPGGAETPQSLTEKVAGGKMAPQQ